MLKLAAVKCRLGSFDSTLVFFSLSYLAAAAHSMATGKDLVETANPT